MTLSITHAKVSAKADGSDATRVQPSDWNAGHSLSGAASPSQGGTGVANNDASTLTISGNFGTTFTVTATTSLTLPTSGTLATTDASSLTSGTLPSGRLSFAAGSDVRTGTDTAKPAHSSAIAGAVSPVGLTDGATINWDMSSAINATVTLGGNRTLATPTNPIAGRTYTLLVSQDATGSRTLTFPAGTIFDFGGAGTPTLSTTASKSDLLTLQCINTSGPLFKVGFMKGT